MKRMVEFADKSNLEIVLAYYPPYHSKYNPIERTWGILENHWNATLLSSIKITLEWAKTICREINQNDLPKRNQVREKTV